MYRHGLEPEAIIRVPDTRRGRARVPRWDATQMSEVWFNNL